MTIIESLIVSSLDGQVTLRSSLKESLKKAPLRLVSVVLVDDLLDIFKTLAYLISRCATCRLHLGQNFLNSILSGSFLLFLVVW